LQKKGIKVNFRHNIVVYRTENKKEPESAVAYEEQYIRALFDKAELKVIEPIHYGSWSGRTGSLSYQDIIIAQKS